MLFSVMPGVIAKLLLVTIGNMERSISSNIQNKIGFVQK